MRQSLHLLIVGGEPLTVPAAWHGARWMLPIVDVPERVRAPLAVARWLRARQLSGHIVGQWLGRAAGSGAVIDWLLVVRVQPSGLARVPDCTWSSWRNLASEKALLDYQGWAVRALGWSDDHVAARGAFATTAWPVEAMSWLRRVLDVRGTITLVPHRVSAHELVVECKTTRGRYFMKGLPLERLNEADVTSRMHEIAPRWFARTVARGPRPDGSAWWLMEACAGRELSSELTPARFAAAAAALARVQQRSALDEAVRSLLPDFDPRALMDWATALVSVEYPAAAEGCRTSITRAWEAVERPRVPWGWVAADLDGANVIVDGEDVRFIDLDDSLAGPTPLAAATLVRRCCAPLSAASAPLAYESAWAPPLALGDRWPAFDLLSRLVECHLAWRRVCRNSERGEVHGVLELVRRSVARRVLTACAVDAGLAL